VDTIPLAGGEVCCVFPALDDAGGVLDISDCRRPLGTVGSDQMQVLNLGPDEVTLLFGGLR
jgi:hypothetical protein